MSVAFYIARISDDFDLHIWKKKNQQHHSLYDTINTVIINNSMNLCIIKLAVLYACWNDDDVCEENQLLLLSAKELYQLQC